MSKVPMIFMGSHDEATKSQLYNCVSIGNVVGAALCADGHVGYAQPVGGVVAYDGQISISGVGYDIACGNMAVKLSIKKDELKMSAKDLSVAIAKNISFGVGRVNDTKVKHDLFDDVEAWKRGNVLPLREKAITQLGTVGSGNHYVDLLTDPEGFVWIGVHFGSRGLGHTIASQYLKAAGGKDGMHVLPTILDDTSDLGEQYIAAMELAGRYAYAGREWVCREVNKLVGGSVIDTVHNHHNFAWKENHYGKDVWVVRKGATPAFEGQRGFVGGSMGDDCVILSGTADMKNCPALLSSTVHGAGRVFGRKDAKRKFTRDEMDAWLMEKQVTLCGGDIDESPMAYRRLSEVLTHHGNTINIDTVLSPFVVVMAGSGEFDPYKD